MLGDKNGNAFSPNTDNIGTDLMGNPQDNPVGDMNDPLSDGNQVPDMPSNEPSGDMGLNPVDGNEPNNNGGDNEINDVFNQLDIEKQSAVLKYAKSMVNNADTPSNDAPKPMGESTQYNLDEIIDSVMKDERKRGNRDITNDKIKQSNPFVSGLNNN